MGRAGRKPSIDEETAKACLADFLAHDSLTCIAENRNVSYQALVRLCNANGWRELKANIDKKAIPKINDRLAEQVSIAIARNAADVVSRQKQLLDAAAMMTKHLGSVDADGKPLTKVTVATDKGTAEVPFIARAADVRALIGAIKDLTTTERTVWGLDVDANKDGPTLIDAHRQLAEREAKSPEWDD